MIPNGLSDVMARVPGEWFRSEKRFIFVFGSEVSGSE